MNARKGPVGWGRILRIGGKGWETRRVRQLVVMVAVLAVTIAVPTPTAARSFVLGFSEVDAMAPPTVPAMLKGVLISRSLSDLSANVAMLKPPNLPMMEYPADRLTAFQSGSR